MSHDYFARRRKVFTKFYSRKEIRSETERSLSFESLGSSLVNSSLGHFSALVGFVELVLDLSELGHVE